MRMPTKPHVYFDWEDRVRCCFNCPWERTFWDDLAINVLVRLLEGIEQCGIHVGLWEWATELHELTNYFDESCCLLFWGFWLLTNYSECCLVSAMWLNHLFALAVWIFDGSCWVCFYWPLEAIDSWALLLANHSWCHDCNLWDHESREDTWATLSHLVV